MPADTQTWTTRKLLAWTTDYFMQGGLESPRVQAEMLLAHVLGCERLRLYMEPDRPADPGERERFRALVKRAGDHEPVDYLVGFTPFFALQFAVSPAVLIPRPSTETLVEYVLQDARQRTLNDTPLRVADIGIGSGAILVSVLKHLPRATGVAVDISAEALDVARENSDTHGVADRIDFREGDLLKPLGDERFDYLLSNPPYIPDAEWDAVAPNVKDYEPTQALRGGADGLDCLRPLIAEAPRYVTDAGRAAFEIAAVQSDAVLRLSADAGWGDPAVLNDHESLPRVLVGSPGGG